MTNQTRPFPAIVEDLLTKVANYGQSRDDSMYFEAFDLQTPDQALAAIIQAVRQLVEDAMPEKKKHEWEARLDTDLEHGHHTGVTDGYNQAIDEYRSNLLAGLK